MNPDKVVTQIKNLGEFIKNNQNSDGSIPSTDEGEHDHWDHLESAMGLAISGFRDEFEAALDWSKSNQNPDGSWYELYSSSSPIEMNKQSNHASYFAVALFCHYLLYKDHIYINSMQEPLTRCLSFISSLQSKSGAIIWNIDEKGNKDFDYLLTGNSSIAKSIQSALHLYKVIGEETNLLKELLINLTDAIKNPSNKFDKKKDRSRFSMDSYYPVLSGVLDKSEETKYIKQTLEKFYVSDLGIKCVSDQPWVTVAETCEFVIALMKVDEKDLAKKLLTDVIQISDENMIPYMGWQYKEKFFWPEEQPNWTAGAEILAFDAVYKYSTASEIFLAN